MHGIAAWASGAYGPGSGGGGGTTALLVYGTSYGGGAGGNVPTGGYGGPGLVVITY
jgi:hypothetical protein